MPAHLCPQAPEYNIRDIFSQIFGDICKSRCTTGINDTSGSYTSGKFATGINNTIVTNFASGAAGVVDTGGKLQLVLMIPAANLPPRHWW
jgi:hypothetical protein